MSSPADALKLLDTSETFDFASDELKKAMSEIMVLHEVPDKHVFVQEGEDIKSWMVVQEGVLARFKDGSGKKMSIEERTESLIDQVLIDTVQGYGRVTGLMHNFIADHTAYATVVSQGPAKVWVVSGQDFRDLLTNTPSFAIEVLAAVSMRLRQESKISRSLLQMTSRSMDGGEDGRSAIRVMCYDTTSWVRNGFQPAIEAFNKTLEENGHKFRIEMDFTEERLGHNSVTRAAGHQAVCTFVNDEADSNVLQALSILGVKMVAQRAAGFDRIDTHAARAFGFTVARVPAYSPYAVAEMGISLLMAVNRKITRASARVKMANFTLDEGLMGVDIHGKTIGVMGTGKIGGILCNILLGFGAKVICFDVYQNDALKEAGCVYVSQEEIYAQSDVIFLMMPLLPATKHTINTETVSKLKHGVILINTSRGGLIDTKALLEGLKSGKISGVGMDVYENESDYFFQDWSARRIPDTDLVSLLGNHNVVLTAHQAFFTKEAVDKIISTTLENLRDFALGKTGLDHPNNCIPVPKA